MNPIPFNPEKLTLAQVKKCAEVMRTMFEMIERESSDADLANYVKQCRDFLITVWSNKP